MKQLKYDIVVIGSGLGGLTSASLLSKAGYKTLVIEKLPFVGGRCTTLDSHGYKLWEGANWFSDEIHGELCREVGAEFDLVVPEPMLYYRIKGKDYPANYTNLLKGMIGQYSRDDNEAEQLWRAFKRSLAWAEPSYSMSLDDWVRQYTDNPGILGVFNFFMVLQVALWSSEVPAGEYFRMIKETGFIRTAGFLPYGGGALSEGLAQAIKEMGGDVWTHCPALQIKVNDGVATGAVVRKDSEEIELIAQVVISNAAPRRTVGLVGSEHLSPGYLKDVEAIKSAPQIVFYIASDRPLIENSSMPLAMPESRRLFYILSCTSICPEVAPKGKHLLMTYSFLTSSLPPYDFNKEVELSLQDLRNNIPDFDKHAQILRINSYHGDWGSAGTWAGYSLPIKTPVEGLYLVGDRSAPLGWWCSPAAIKSGRLVVEDITRRFKPA